MSKVTAFERFLDAVDRRASQLNRDGYDYKAGFFQTFLEGLSDSSPQVASQLVAAARMLEKWADEDEVRNRASEVDIAM